MRVVVVAVLPLDAMEPPQPQPNKEQAMGNINNANIFVKRLFVRFVYF
jgi:hypothetical protein